MTVTTKPGAARGNARRPAAPQPRRAPFAGLVVGAGVILLLISLRAFTAESDAWALPDRAQDFLTLSISVVVESIPFIFLGIVLSVLVQVWLPEGAMVRFLPKNGFLRRAVISLIGMLLPVCECGNVPLARGLVMRGFSPAESIVFLLAAPILNPITIVTTYQAFGWDNGILFARIVGGFVIANVIGWMFSRHPAPESILTERFAAACRVDDSHRHPQRRVAKSLDLFVRETSSMLPALFVGAGLAGLVQVTVSREVLVELGGNPVLSILTMMVLAFVISICSNVDAFFALSLGSTFMPGSIVAFLTFGPMIDVKMIALMRTTYTAKTIAQITLVVALCVAVLALAVNYVA